MLALLRIVFGFALFSVFAKAVRLAGPEPQTEGTTDAGYLAVAVAIGILNAIVWAPWIGRLMADPLTGAFTTGHPAERSNQLLQFAHKLALRRWRRWALFFAFLEGVRHPDLPGAFVLGMTHSKAGSWLETLFAKEVWRFDNAENCLKAWRILRARGLAPELHRRAEVNLLIQGQTRVVPPPPLPLAVPQAAAAPVPKRNERIQLFQGAAASPVTEAGTEPPRENRSELTGSPVDAPIVASDPEFTSPEATPTRDLSVTEGSASGPGMGAAAPPLSFKQRLKVLFTGRPGS